MKTTIKLPAGMEVKSLRFLDVEGKETFSTKTAVELEVVHRFIGGRSTAACLFLVAAGDAGRERTSLMTVAGNTGKFKVSDFGEETVVGFDAPATQPAVE